MDPPSFMGLSHFLEHMVFKGTHSRNAGDIAISLEQLGGSLNGFTEKEFTCFYATVLDEYLENAVDILADLVINPRFDVSDFEIEKQVIFEEIHSVQDTPDDLIHELFVQYVFEPHSLGYPILGTLASVEAITPETVQSFWQSAYKPPKIFVSAAGHLDHNQFVDSVRSKFSKLRNIKQNTYDQVKIGSKRHESVTQKIKQGHVCLGYPGLGYTNPDKFALILINTYLGAGMSSRLFQEIREKYGLAYSIYSFTDYYTDTGLFGIYAGTAGDRLDLTIEAIQKQLTVIKKEGIPEKEIERLKAQIRGHLLLAQEDVSNRMSRMAKMIAYTNDYLDIDTVIRRIEAVSAADILRVSRFLFNENSLYQVTIRPEK